MDMLKRYQSSDYKYQGDGLAQRSGFDEAPKLSSEFDHAK
jgi:hypothetical protein